jgi:hypothetical protein
MKTEYDFVYFFQCPYKVGEKVFGGAEDDEGTKGGWQGYASVTSVEVDENEPRKIIRCKIVHDWINH